MGGQRNSTSEHRFGRTYYSQENQVGTMNMPRMDAECNSEALNDESKVCQPSTSAGVFDDMLIEESGYWERALEEILLYQCVPSELPLNEFQGFRPLAVEELQDLDCNAVERSYDDKMNTNLLLESFDLSTTLFPSSALDSKVSKARYPTKRKITYPRDDEDDDSDNNEGYLNDSDLESDAESSASDPERQKNYAKFAESFLTLGIHCKPYFWQYNSQARGPKAKRILPPLSENDFHVLSSCIDPVSNKAFSAPGSHSTQIKQGEGNNFRPDPRKLLTIGSRIDKMEGHFKSLAPGETVTKKTVEKEKNKLASRICRLRRKAQHEANKIQLEGLNKEHGQLMSVIKNLLMVFDSHLPAQSNRQFPVYQRKVKFCDQLKELISKNLSFMVAGHRANFVNKELATAAETMMESNTELLSEKIT